MSVLSGILAGLCFPKFSLYWLAIVALVPLFLKIEKEDAKSAFRSGYLFGLVFLGINLFWIIAADSRVLPEPAPNHWP